MSANDKKREFKVTEVKRTTSGGYTDLSNKFVWDRETQSSPRNAWEYALKLRTVREDYSGGNFVTEQVLGWNFEPFTLEGVWDDRYAGAGFAEGNRLAWEAMFTRGPTVRLEFEGIQIVGLITHFAITYRQQFRQGYAFTFSPHVRDDNTIVDLAPRAISNPDDYRVQAQAIVEQAKEFHLAAPREYLVGTIWAGVDAVVTDWDNKMTDVAAIVANRILVADPASQAVNSVARLAQQFTDLATSAGSMLDLVGALPSDTSLSFESALNNLNLECWSRGLAFQARALLTMATQAAQELSQRVDSSTRALYRPHAEESLYAISNRFYNTPHRWRDIQARNNLTGIVLDGTELLIIPDRKAT